MAAAASKPSSKVASTGNKTKVIKLPTAPPELRTYTTEQLIKHGAMSAKGATDAGLELLRRRANRYARRQS